MKLIHVLPLLLLAVAPGCKKKPPEPERICDDRADNDDDGLIDCDDPDCGVAAKCQVPTTELECTNGLDDDEDGKIDCADTDCARNGACVEQVCDDGLDNDSDGKIDCDDANCSKDPACRPVAVVARNFQLVHFEFDSSTLTGESMNALRENAKIFQENQGLKVEVQGHADERGTTEYNLALGQKRAETIKEKLTSMGVSPSQISIISFGEERPVDRSSTEIAWSVNRRAEFRITSTAPEGVTGTVK